MSAQLRQDLKFKTAWLETKDTSRIDGSESATRNLCLSKLLVGRDGRARRGRQSARSPYQSRVRMSHQKNLMCTRQAHRSWSSRSSVPPDFLIQKSRLNPSRIRSTRRLSSVVSAWKKASEY